MKKTLTLNDFRNMIVDFGRSANFSYHGAEILFNALEMLEEDSGEEMEADIIALCCDFTEEPLKDWAENYRDEDIKQLNQAEQLEHLENDTWLLGSYKNEAGEMVVIYQAY